MLWLLATSLVLPWFDYGKTYRPVAQAIAQALPADHGCLAERGLSDTQLASLSYFVEIEPVAEDSKAGQACNWLLVVGDTRRELAPPSSRWNKVWEGNRPGDRRKNSASTGAEACDHQPVIASGRRAFSPSGNVPGNT
jgi:hypothetical protein